MIFPVGGRLIGVKFYTSSTTWTRPENCTSIIIIGIGAGGSGADTGIVTASPTATTFGSALSCGAGGAGSNIGPTNGTSGTVTGSDISSFSSSQWRHFLNLFGYGAGGLITNDFTNSLNSNASGGSGGLGIKFINSGLLDSYVVTIGTPGSVTGTRVLGSAGCLVIVEFGG
jgi:hypothetical protein